MRRVWRRCDFHFRTEETESSTVRLVLGSCDGSALLVRDDALNLTLSRPSSGFGTFQLDAVMFRKPNWVAYRKPLRSSFCTRLSSSMSCDVVCFFFYPEHPKAFLVTGRVQRPSTIGPVVACGSSVTKGGFRGKFSSVCAALILQQFVYHNQEMVGVDDLVCGAQEAACLRVLCV